jgi:hypothetical protein
MTFDLVCSSIKRFSFTVDLFTLTATLRELSTAY